MSYRAFKLLLFTLAVLVYFTGEYLGFRPVNGITNESCLLEKSLSFNANPIGVGNTETGTKTHSRTTSESGSLEINLGKTGTLCFIDIGWLNGEKAYSFHLSASYSLDAPYDVVYSGKSIATTTELQRIDFQDIEARLLKITMTGNSKNIADIAEVDIYAYQPTSGGSRLPALPNLPSYDNFGNRSNTVSKWSVQYTGYGLAGIKNSTEGSIYSMSPRASRNASETHAVLVKSTGKFSDFRLVADVKTDRQLRQNSSPNAWEVAWILFRYTDTFHYYWFSLKPNGIELGKKSCNHCVNPVDGQIILFTAAMPTLKLRVDHRCRK
jgi:hypothetical protein